MGRKVLCKAELITMKSQALLILLVIIATFKSITCNNIFHVNSSRQLEELINRTSKGIDSTSISLLLDSSVEYELSGEKFSYFINKTITIRSNDNYYANITCIKPSHRTRGLAFLSSTVILEKLKLSKCGTVLTKLPNQIVEKITLTSNNHAAVFLFIQSYVNMDSVKVFSSCGFSIIGLNLQYSKFINLDIQDTITVIPAHSEGTGTGMLLHFSDYNTSLPRIFVSLTNVQFINNTSIFTRGRRICLYEYYTRGISHHTELYAAGLTVHYTQKLYKVVLTVLGGKFFQNSGVYAGAILIVHHRNAVSNTTITQSMFKRNAVSMCHATAIQFYHFGGTHMTGTTKIFTIQNSSFEGDTHIQHAKALSAIEIGAYSLLSKLNFEFTSLIFTKHSTPNIVGTCMSIIHYKNSGETHNIEVNMNNITASHNSRQYNRNIPVSLFYFENIKMVNFTGTGKFQNNLGSVIHVVESNLILWGNFMFSNNTAESGAAIKLHGHTYIQFVSGLNISFVNNHAYYSGGAIHAVSTLYKKCVLQTKFKKLNITFSKNTATTAGNSIFMSPISKCEVDGFFHPNWLFRYLKHLKLSRMNQRNGLLPLSTLPTKLSIHQKIGNEYSKINETLYKYPGEALFVQISAIDVSNRKVFSFVIIKLFSNDRETHVWLQQSGGSEVLESNKTTKATLSIHTDTSALIATKLVFSIPEIFGKEYPVKVLPCPTGFSIKKSSGSCDCLNIFNKLLPGTECLINQKIIKRQIGLNAWIGVITNDVAISTICPLMYCNNNPQYQFIKFTTNETVLTNNQATLNHPLCLNNRTGILCGNCNNGYSTVFGSDDCKQCSNLWLTTGIIYVIAGPLLIYVLYKLRLTLTGGTINGVIFYVQAANAGLLDYMTTSPLLKYHAINQLNIICRSILLFLNLNLGFPLCFYNGMNQLWKTGLGLIFPVYLLIIVAFIIIISRYSTWLSNRTAHLSIQVLITVVHLSFSKLLATLIDVFTAANVQTVNKDYQVWYKNGSIAYMGSQHYPLAIVTALIVSLFLIPYICLLLLGKMLMKFSSTANFYVRPILESVHGPYKNGRQYWFVARLILLIIVYIMYVLLRTKNNNILSIAAVILLSSFTVAQALSNPFKKTILNVLDCWLMLNITITYNTIWNKASVAFAICNTLTTTLALLTFGGILLYHIITATKCRNRKFMEFTEKLLTKTKYLYKGRQIQLHNTTDLYGSCRQFREPMITEVTCD